MTSEKQRCPSCGNTSVRKRGVNTPGNISRRTVEKRYHRFVCDNDECEWTGTSRDIDWVENTANGNSALEW